MRTGNRPQDTGLTMAHTGPALTDPKPGQGAQPVTTRFLPFHVFSGPFIGQLETSYICE